VEGVGEHRGVRPGEVAVGHRGPGARQLGQSSSGAPVLLHLGARHLEVGRHLVVDGPERTTFAARSSAVECPGLERAEAAGAHGRQPVDGALHRGHRATDLLVRARVEVGGDHLVDRRAERRDHLRQTTVHRGRRAATQTATHGGRLGREPAGGGHGVTSSPGRSATRDRAVTSSVTEERPTPGSDVREAVDDHGTGTTP
jgi:hypothetical protein